MPEKCIAKLAQLVRDYMGDRDISVRDFAKIAGLSSSYVQKLRNAEMQDIRIGTLTKIAQAMGITFIELTERIELTNVPRDYFSTHELTKIAPKPYKDVLDQHGEKVIRIAKKIALSDISVEQLEKIVDAITEIKKG